MKSYCMWSVVLGFFHLARCFQVHSCFSMLFFFFFTAELYFIVRTHTHLFMCIWNPMDSGAWWATVRMVAKSWAQLKQLSLTYLDDHIKLYKHHPNRCRQSIWQGLVSFYDLKRKKRHLRKQGGGGNPIRWRVATDKSTDIILNCQRQSAFLLSLGTSQRCSFHRFYSVFYQKC